METNQTAMETKETGTNAQKMKPETSRQQSNIIRVLEQGNRDSSGFS